MSNYRATQAAWDRILAQWHLDALKTALSGQGWRVTEKPGNGRDIAASWELQRGNDARRPVLDFQGLDDMNTLPIERAYACTLRGTTTSLYFGRKGDGTNWTEQLAAFVRQMETPDAGIEAGTRSAPTS